MSSLLYDKSDVHMDNDDLGEINDWAIMHARFCPMMKSTIEGYSSMTYTIEYCKNTGKLNYGCQCQCGMKMILHNS